MALGVWNADLGSDWLPDATLICDRAAATAVRFPLLLSRRPLSRFFTQGAAHIAITQRQDSETIVSRSDSPSPPPSTDRAPARTRRSHQKGPA